MQSKYLLSLEFKTSHTDDVLRNFCEPLFAFLFNIPENISYTLVKNSSIIFWICTRHYERPVQVMFFR